MSSASKWLAVWPLFPLVLASLAVGMRGMNKTPRPVALPKTPARAFAPPAALLRAAHGESVVEDFTIRSAASRARLQLAPGLPALEFELRGHLRLESDESLGALELELTPEGAGSAARRTVALRLGAAAARSSPIPGLHAALPAGRVSSDGEDLPVRFLASWMRLPGGRLQAHLVSEPLSGLDQLCLRPAPSRTPWAARTSAVLSLIMDLDSSAAQR